MERIHHDAGSPVNILLVDDHHENLLALETLLSDLGQNLVFAQSSEEALKRLLKDDFALMLLDVQMPEIDGFEMARLIRERKKTRALPIIFLTAVYLHEQDKLHGYELGAVDYIVKPYDPTVLRSKVRTFIKLKQRAVRLQNEIRRRRRAEAVLQKTNEALESRVRERTAELEAASRAKDQFLAALAHELRNPLAPMLNIVEALRGRGLDDKKQAQWGLDVLQRQVQHLTRLVDDLLDVARITRGAIELRREPLALAKLVREAVESSRPEIEAKQHQLSIALPGEPLWVEADAIRLSQVLANLLNNAAKYTDPKGQIALAVTHEGEEAIIRVRDTGMGIAGEMLPRVFDLFAQGDRSLDRAQGGLGIGLSLVKRLVELHGGRVAAASAGPGQGSEFTVRLPRIPAPPPAAALQRKVTTGPAGCRFLVVDDNADGAEGLALTLQMAGHEAQVAYDGPSALTLARQTPPDVVVLDIGLPGLDGYEVTRRLRSELGLVKARLIALTGYGQDEDRRRSREAGFDHHLVKPASGKEILELLAIPVEENAAPSVPIGPKW
ncbi:MAG: ATP-binding response regulator [Gammaproteobacteria bacterium]